MEIPTKEIIEKLMGISQVTVMEESALEAIKVIEAQALEIKELQLVIVRLRDEIGAMGEELDSENAIIIKLENNLLTN